MKKFNFLDTILSPNITEKSTSLSEYNKVVFKVQNDPTSIFTTVLCREPFFVVKFEFMSIEKKVCQISNPNFFHSLDKCLN